MPRTIGVLLFAAAWPSAGQRTTVTGRDCRGNWNMRCLDFQTMDGQTYASTRTCGGQGPTQCRADPYPNGCQCCYNWQQYALNKYGSASDARGCDECPPTATDPVNGWFVSDASTPGGDKVPCAEYCCNPDNQATGPWCYVQGTASEKETCATEAPTESPTQQASPSVSPTRNPVAAPSAPPVGPTPSPTLAPSGAPSVPPSQTPSRAPSSAPTAAPADPTASPSAPPQLPTAGPSAPPVGPTQQPSQSPVGPTQSPAEPTAPPTAAPARPTTAPSATPSAAPSRKPSRPPQPPPSMAPSDAPSASPTAAPVLPPSAAPSAGPSAAPSQAPRAAPSAAPSSKPSTPPSAAPTPPPPPTSGPSAPPSPQPSAGPSATPTPPPPPSAGPTVPPSPQSPPSAGPSGTPTASPLSPSGAPTAAPMPQTVPPSAAPSMPPTVPPTAPTAPPEPGMVPPTARPSLPPSGLPSGGPSAAPAPPPGAPTRAPAPPSAPPSAAPAVPSRAPSFAPVTPGSPTASPAAPSSSPSAGLSMSPSAALSLPPSAPGAPAVSPTVAPSRGAAPTAPSATPAAPTALPAAGQGGQGGNGSAPSASPTAPATPAPAANASFSGGGLSEAQKKTLKGGRTAAAAVSAASLGAAGANVGKLAILSNLDCEVEDVDLSGAEPLDWEFHPVQVPIGSHDQKYFVGAVVFNPLICIGVLLVLLCVAGLQVTMCAQEWPQARGNMRSPGLVYIPVLFLLQGTSLSAGDLVYHPSTALLTLLGWVVLVACFALPGLLYWTLLRDKAFMASSVSDPRLCQGAAEFVAESGGDQHAQLSGWKRKAYLFCFGPKIWVSTHPPTYFAEQYGVCFESYREGRQWFCCVEQGSVLGVSALAAWRPEDEAPCHIRNTLLCLLFAIFIVLVVRLRPYASRLDFVVSVTLAVMMLLAILSITISIMVGGSPGLLTIAAINLFASCVLLAAKCVWDIVAYSIDMKIGRRRGAWQTAQKVGDVSTWQGKSRIGYDGDEELTDEDMIPRYDSLSHPSQHDAGADMSHTSLYLDRGAAETSSQLSPWSQPLVSSSYTGPSEHAADGRAATPQRDDLDPAVRLYVQTVYRPQVGSLGARRSQPTLFDLGGMGRGSQLSSHQDARSDLGATIASMTSTMGGGVAPGGAVSPPARGASPGHRSVMSSFASRGTVDERRWDSMPSRATSYSPSVLPSMTSGGVDSLAGTQTARRQGHSGLRQLRVVPGTAHSGLASTSPVHAARRMQRGSVAKSGPDWPSGGHSPDRQSPTHRVSTGRRWEV
eukprot:TRINITY_DN8648_c0_g1_i1.p1 TRINITY_DN8648_c0_g1~~TRINITY_DN8648_c0_g1_i1.p1  ORF type:complete len:1282 (+),score=207.74 TRINITY_DN8648_c0_g1_i1:135-3980(+)